jgi:hypothetical protein
VLCARMRNLRTHITTRLGRTEEIAKTAIETRAQEELCAERKQFWTPTKRRSLTVDSFERLTGFREADYYDTRGKLVVEGDQLRSLANGKSSGIGYLELVSLADLRENGAGSRTG